MTYTRQVPPSTSVTTPQRVQVQTGTSVDENGRVRCTNHQKVCKRQVAGPTTKNPGRAFYACPLGRNDPNRCKFFKWEDELQGTTSRESVTPSSSTSSRAAQLVQSTNQTLGQSPVKRFGTTLSKSSNNTAISTLKNTAGSSKVGDTDKPRNTSINSEAEDRSQSSEREREISPVANEIDWGAVDTDNLEREAIASTPGSTQRRSSQSQSQSRSIQATTPSRPRSEAMLGKPNGQGTESAEGGMGSAGFRGRLREAVDDGLKRKREEGEGDQLATPTNPKFQRLDPNNEENPFLTTTPTPNSPFAHALLTPTLHTLSDLGEHISRQDRLLRAADQMKQGLRKTVASLQERNKELEGRVKELEAALARKG